VTALGLGLVWVSWQARIVTDRMNVQAELRVIYRHLSPYRARRTWTRDPIRDSSPWWYACLGDSHLHRLRVPYAEHDPRSARIRDLFPDAEIQGISITPVGQSAPLYGADDPCVADR